MSHEQIETRYITPELRLIGDNQTLRGMIPYNTLSQELGSFRERIAPGAFRQSVESDDIRAFWGHQHDSIPIGRTKSGTLRLKDGERGLNFEVDLPDTTTGNDLRTSIERGDVDGVSFGFVSSRDTWSDKGKIRTVMEARSMEISPVNWPAYPDATVALRSFSKWNAE